MKKETIKPLSPAQKMNIQLRKDNSKLRLIVDRNEDLQRIVDKLNSEARINRERHRDIVSDSNDRIHQLVHLLYQAMFG